MVDKILCINPSLYTDEELRIIDIERKEVKEDTLDDGEWRTCSLLISIDYNWLLIEH